MKREAALKVVVDRIEGDKAVLVASDNDEVTFNLPLEYLPKGTRGGDHLGLVFTEDVTARKAEEEKARRLLDELTRDSEA